MSAAIVLQYSIVEHLRDPMLTSIFDMSAINQYDLVLHINKDKDLKMLRNVSKDSAYLAAHNHARKFGVVTYLINNVKHTVSDLETRTAA